MSNPTGWDAPKPEVPDDPALAGPADAVPDQAPDGFTPAELATPESDSMPEVISSDLAPRLALDDADPGGGEAPTADAADILVAATCSNGRIVWSQLLIGRP